MKVACIIVTHNGQPWIVQCVSSVLDSTDETHVIVVDNASTDNSKQLVKNFPEVELIELDDNVGFGAANNIGLRRALSLGVEYVLLLNQDAWVAGDAIEQLVDIARANPEIGILSPLHWNGDGSVLDSNFSDHLLNAVPETENNSVAHDPEEAVRYVSFVNAAIWLISRNCLERIGGFDPLFFMYGEDNDYCQRVKWHNLKIGITPKASAYHARGVVYPRRSLRQKLRKQATLLYSTMVFMLKDPRRSFYRNLRGVAYMAVKSFFVSVPKGDFVEFPAHVLALAHVMVMLGKIQQHRQESLQVGAHWLC